MRAIMPALLLGLFAASAAGQAPSRSAASASSRPAPMRAINTPYYVLHTDVSDDLAREATLRMTRMFEEYQRRTAGFAGQVNEKLPFYLFTRASDYYAAGGPAKSAGVFIRDRNGSRLLAIADDRSNAETWDTIQHEGFHQFADAAIKFPLPVWINEGLAEYFGAGLWTGDGFVTGLVPPGRLRAVQAGIRGGAFKPFKVLMALDQKQWNEALTTENYDEAWAMVHFLANADNGRYQGGILELMQQVSRGITSDNAWQSVYGRDVEGFQARFSQWWLSVPEDATRNSYLRAIVQIETSFLARAYLLKKMPADADAFVRAYDPPAQASIDLWLPPALQTDLRDMAPDLGQWSFQRPAGSAATAPPKLVLQSKDGLVITGTFTVANNKVARVTADITTAPTKPNR